MVLRWNPSESDGGSKITEYVVERREVGKKTWKKVGSSSSKNTYLEIRGLKKDCSFNFRISAKNNIGLSQPLVLDETAKGKAEVKTVSKGLPGSPSIQVRFFFQFESFHDFPPKLQAIFFRSTFFKQRIFNFLVKFKPFKFLHIF